jgi:succinate dehydrogenase/fumarate reductase cytochrome b subunit
MSQKEDPNGEIKKAPAWAKVALAVGIAMTFVGGCSMYLMVKILYPLAGKEPTLSAMWNSWPAEIRWFMGICLGIIALVIAFLLLAGLGLILQKIGVGSHDKNKDTVSHWGIDRKLEGRPR